MVVSPDYRVQICHEGKWISVVYSKTFDGAYLQLNFARDHGQKARLQSRGPNGRFRTWLN